MKGFALVTFLLFLVIGAIVLAGVLNVTSDILRSGNVSGARSAMYYTAEDSHHRALSWLRGNSKKLASPFLRANFYTAFQRTKPDYGANDLLAQVPTKVKLVGGGQSAILTNESELATGAFPKTIDLDTGLLFPAQSNFASSNLGDGKVRLTLVDAIAITPAKDFGPPPNPTPQTDFYPVYRIDSLGDTDHGAQLYGYLVGEVVRGYSPGFYGATSARFRRDCDSYNASTGPYSVASRTANCTVGSNSLVRIDASRIIYGSAVSNGTVQLLGSVCADFAPGCPNPGEICQGTSCNVPPGQSFDPWNSYCPANQGNLDITVNTVLTVSGDAPLQKCWNQVRIRSNRQLTLTTTAYSYFFQQLRMDASSTLVITPAPATDSVKLFVATMNDQGSNRIQASKIVNSFQQPARFRFNYLGNANFTVNVNAAMYLALQAPYAQVTTSGNQNFFGAMSARILDVSGNVALHYDESLGTGNVSDIKYTLHAVGQKYR